MSLNIGYSCKLYYFRQSKYYHIPESRNSAVIPVKISKRMSTHSNYNITRYKRVITRYKRVITR